MDYSHACVPLRCLATAWLVLCRQFKHEHNGTVDPDDRRDVYKILKQLAQYIASVQTYDTKVYWEAPLSSAVCDVSRQELLRHQTELDTLR